MDEKKFVIVSLLILLVLLIALKEVQKDIFSTQRDVLLTQKMVKSIQVSCLDPIIEHEIAKVRRLIELKGIEK